METQLNHSTYSDVLRSILATLQNLETRSENQNTRLGAIELLIASSACADVGSPSISPYSRHVSVIHDGKTPPPSIATFESPLDHTAATAYAASVIELGKQFSLRGCPSPEDVDEHAEEIDEYEGSECADRDNDQYSMSVYSSRPLSRLELDIPPIPPLPRKSVQRERAQSEPVVYDSTPHGSCQVLAMTYEATAEGSTSPSSVPSTPHRSSTGSQDRPWFSISRHSASTGRTSISIEGASSATGSKRGMSTTLHGAYSNIKHSLPQASQFIRRTFSITATSSDSKGKAKVSQPCQTLRIDVDYLVPVTNLEENNATADKRGLPFLQLAEKTARACVSVFPFVLSLLTREATFIPR
ncbi:hypothetical protein F5Y04DRAFT_184950 [Hypomontagnella monticulosa]|nr:hypothetical protein F5Y04DRAFT_184950 [Hypomontagnella monticulosa]